MKHRLQTAAGKKMYAERKITSEPVFGIIKAVTAAWTWPHHWETPPSFGFFTQWHVQWFNRVCGVDDPTYLGKAASIASGNPFRPSTQAIRMSFTQSILHHLLKWNSV